MKKTAIVILNYNNFEDTVNCIGSILKYNTAPCKFIIIDNGSTRSGTVQKIDDFLKEKFGSRYQHYDYEEKRIPDVLPDVSLVVSKKNDGYACGNNKGLEYAYRDNEVDKVLIINNDVLFIEDIIPQLARAIDDIDDCAVISPLLLKKDGISIDYNCARLAHSVWQVLMPYFFMYKDFAGVLTRRKRQLQILRKNPVLTAKPKVHIELPSGSCMMIDKKLMKQVGGFDPHTFLYYEENILYKKFLKLGKKSYLIPKLKCIHLGASTTKKCASTFMLKVGIDSTRYYLENYCQLNFFQRIVMNVSYFNIKMKLKFIHIVGYFYRK